MCSPGRHFPQLDALRAFAVGAVLLAHFSPTIAAAMPQLGFAGVRLFFVISGFLITGILLRARDAIRAGESTFGAETGRFFLRRTLRIFPAFYLLLLANAALDIGSTREDFWWHAAYLSNVLMGLDGNWRDLLTHLWSLAVEEQFYLLWPLLVLGACRSPASLRLLFIAAVAAGPLFRLATVLLAPGHPLAPLLLTPACFDLLGAGALLAWLRHRRGEHDPARRPWRRLGFLLLPVALAAALPFPPWASDWQTVLAPAVQAFAFAALVDGAAIGFRGALAAPLSWPPLLWIGRISYGIYLYHNNAHWIGPRLLRWLTGYRVAYFPSETLHVLYLSALSLVAATLGWYLIERPINFRKERICSFFLRPHRCAAPPAR